MRQKSHAIALMFRMMTTVMVSSKEAEVTTSHRRRCTAFAG